MIRMRQVVIYTKNNYIDTHRSFDNTSKDIKKMLVFIDSVLNYKDASEIRITRWNSKGEKE